MINNVTINGVTVTQEMIFKAIHDARRSIAKLANRGLELTGKGHVEIALKDSGSGRRFCCYQYDLPTGKLSEVDYIKELNRSSPLIFLEHKGLHYDSLVVGSCLEDRELATILSCTIVYIIRSKIE